MRSVSNNLSTDWLRPSSRQSGLVDRERRDDLGDPYVKSDKAFDSISEWQRRPAWQENAKDTQSGNLLDLMADDGRAVLESNRRNNGWL